MRSRIFINMNAKSSPLVAKNLDWLMTRAKISENALAVATGVNQPTINRILSGSSKEPRQSTLKPLADYFGTKVSDLMETDLTSNEANFEDGPNFRSRRGYPVISWVQAGEWTALCDNFEPGDAEEWRACHKDLGRCGYALRVKGKSMTAPEGEPYSFPEGIVLYVNPDMEALPGKFVIVRRNQTKEATFKRYILVDGEPYLEAINPDWPNRYLKLAEGDQFCGVVMHAGFDMP